MFVAHFCQLDGSVWIEDKVDGSSTWLHRKPESLNDNELMSATIGILRSDHSSPSNLCPQPPEGQTESLAFNPLALPGLRKINGAQSSLTANFWNPNPSITNWDYHEFKEHLVPQLMRNRWLRKRFGQRFIHQYEVRSEGATARKLHFYNLPIGQFTDKTEGLIVMSNKPGEIDLFLNYASGCGADVQGFYLGKLKPSQIFFTHLIAKELIEALRRPGCAVESLTVQQTMDAPTVLPQTSFALILSKQN